MTRLDTLRVVGSPETNKVMAGELRRLATRALGRRLTEPRKVGTGTLLYPFDPELADLAVRYQRTATRVLWDLYGSEAPRLEPLYAEITADVAADDRGWLWDGATISVEVRNVESFAAGERQIVGTIKNAIIDGALARGLRSEVDAEHADVSIMVRGSPAGPGRPAAGAATGAAPAPEGLTVSVDLAGASLSQRGWRVDHGVAPLREHLAAVLLMLGRWDVRREILLDPTCGAGTIPIEAALMGRAAPLWQEPRRPACQRLPAFHDAAGDRGPLFADARPVVIGNDQDLAALIMAKQNATAAGLSVAQGPVWRRGDFAALRPRDIADLAVDVAGPDAPQTGLILGNPPYGERMDEIDARLIYGELGDMCRRFRGWRAAFIVANREMEPIFGNAVGAPPRLKKPLSNGPLRGYFLMWEL